MKKATIWIRDDDEERFSNICDAELSSYSDGILTGELEKPGVLGALNKEFALGRKKVWQANSEDKGRPFVRIKEHSIYPQGLILTPYSETHVKYGRRTRTITETTGISRVELFGSDYDDFVRRVFNTYSNDVFVRKSDERDEHLLLYDITAYKP